MTKLINCSNANNGGVAKKKERRHIVSWSQEEDDILREQIRVHGTDNWTVIASKFKDKTARQCRRRWFTYLNSDFKRGGWSPEEDVLLCEAQKVFGNRWTEIAKVVSGRTDNAVKNRFTTLCKKRAKHEALAKENHTTSYVNLNNKRVIIQGGSESVAPLKMMRTFISSTEEKLGWSEGDVADHLLRHPFVVLAGNIHRSEVNLFTQLYVDEIKVEPVDAPENNKMQGTFLMKDDPKLLALMQQEELLSSLATKVNSEKTDQSLESAWMALQKSLKEEKESEMITFSNPSTEFQLEKFEESMADLRSSNEGSEGSWREPDICASSPNSSEYSTGSTLLSDMPSDKTEECRAEICVLQQETGVALRSDPAEESGLCHNATAYEVNMVTCNDLKDNNGAACKYTNTEFGSPLHMTPVFRTLAAAIPSPKFSESEKHFLMRTLGIESSPSSTITDPSQTPPPCKRSLLHCL